MLININFVVYFISNLTNFKFSTNKIKNFNCQFKLILNKRWFIIKNYFLIRRFEPLYLNKLDHYQYLFFFYKFKSIIKLFHTFFYLYIMQLNNHQLKFMDLKYVQIIIILSFYQIILNYFLTLLFNKDILL